MKKSSLLISREISSLRQQTTDRIREAILYGHFSPGEKLIEGNLCELLGISRTILREAMQHLQAEGLITSIPHKGPIVSSVNAEEAHDIYQVRKSLEALAGKEFALNATDQQILDLRVSLEYLKTDKASESPQNLLEAKNSFYDILLDGCGNQVVAQILKLLNNRVTILRRRSLGRPGRLKVTLKELEGIMKAIEARDAVNAKKLCAAHVENAAKIVADSFLQLD